MADPAVKALSALAKVIDRDIEEAQRLYKAQDGWGKLCVVGELSALTKVSRALKIVAKELGNGG